MIDFTQSKIPTNWTLCKKFSGKIPTQYTYPKRSFFPISLLILSLSLIFFFSTCYSLFFITHFLFIYNTSILSDSANFMKMSLLSNIKMVDINLEHPENSTQTPTGPKLSEENVYLYTPIYFHAIMP